jgi:hypothetical protein
LEGRRVTLSVALLGALTVASCGGGERQDANEPEGRFPVEVVSAEFPTTQKLAKRSDLEIVVRNSGRKAVPNVAVTVRGFDVRLEGRGLSDPERPVFVINGEPKEIGTFPESKEAAPEGGETAYVDTWALGRLRPGQRKAFRWSVTAVRPGPFRLRYEIAAGLDGKARAVTTGGGTPRGMFRGSVSDAAPDTRVADDGSTIISGTR